MTTRQEEFKSKLFALLREYNVEMSVREDFQRWDTQVVGIEFYANPTWDADGNTTEEGINFTVGTWEDGKNDD